MFWLRHVSGLYPQRQEEGFRFPQLELQMVVIYRKGAGKGTLVS